MTTTTATFLDEGEDGDVDGAGNTNTPDHLHMRGVNKYRAYKYVRPPCDLREIWRSGAVSLRCVPNHEYLPENPAAVLVPSMINKSYIFDLTRTRSMARWLAGQGINVYVLDWGDPNTDAAARRGINDIVLSRLLPALRHVRGLSDAPIHALGYCMGGTLLLGAAQHHLCGDYAYGDDMLRGIICLSAPWDFHAGSGGLLSAVKFWAPSGANILGVSDVMPASALQAVFTVLDPDAARRKFTAFARMSAPKDEALFAATEHWVNDGVDLPRAVAKTCIYDWFINNAPARGDWILSGTPVHPEHINCPVLMVAARRDRVVEPPMMMALQGGLRDATIHTPVCGHIGMIAGRRAVADVWIPIAAWIKNG